MGPHRERPVGVIEPTMAGLERKERSCCHLKLSRGLISQSFGIQHELLQQKRRIHDPLQKAHAPVIHHTVYLIGSGPIEDEMNSHPLTGNR